MPNVEWPRSTEHDNTPSCGVKFTVAFNNPLLLSCQMGCCSSQHVVHVENPLSAALQLRRPVRVTIDAALRCMKQRGVLADEPVLRDVLFLYVRYPFKAPYRVRANYKLRQRNLIALNDLIVNGEKYSLACPPGQSLAIRMKRDFSDFILPAPFTGRLDAIYQRRQRSKQCAPNSVALLQASLVNRSDLLDNQGAILSVRMLNVSEYWASVAPARLAYFLFSVGEAQRSEQLLSSVLLPGSVIGYSTWEQCAENLIRFGFALVTGMRIYDDLHDSAPDTFRFRGPPVGGCVDPLNKQRL